MKIFGLDIRREKSLNNTYNSSILMNYDSLLGKFSPYCEKNYFTLFKQIAEIQYPIRFICDRALKADILLKRYSDDSIVWTNKRINSLMDRVNPYYSFKEMMSLFIQMKLICGNAYIYAKTSDIFKQNLWQYCDEYYVLPSQDVNIEIDFSEDFFNKDNYIKGYNCFMYNKTYKLNKNLVLHVRDSIDYNENTLKGFSRLVSQKYTLSNLIAVYEARNVIYTKRGALGAIISAKSDQDGTLPLTPQERDELQEEFQNRYGLSGNKNQFIISKNPINFVKFGCSISELQPFEETLQDCIQLAGIFGVNKELIPRKDNSTFSNIHSAEVDCFSNTIIPLVNEFLAKFSSFIGLTTSGFYLDADFSKVEVLAENKAIRVQEQKNISDRCKIEFNMGIITLNDWRTQVGLELINMPIYNKTLLQMNDSEIIKIKSFLS